MNKVFIVELPRNIDLSAALMYGEVISLFNRVHRRRSVFDCTNFGWDVLNALKREEYNAKSDYICIVGNILNVTLAIAAALSQHEEIMLLLFDAPSSKYVKRVIKGTDWEGIDGNCQC